MTRKDTNVIGRREELSLLRELIAPPHKESHVLLLLGDPGLGKTVLLAEAAREAKAAGMRVLATTGRESEQDLAFAGLHQLLRPVLDRVARLPTRQAEALRGAFGLSDDPAPPDALLTSTTSALSATAHRDRRTHPAVRALRRAAAAGGGR